MGLDKNRRGILADGFNDVRVTTSTSPSTALSPRGVIALATTSTTGPVVYTLAHGPKRGRKFEIHALSVAATSAPFHVNAGAGIGVGTSSEDMLTLTLAGDGASLTGLSTSRWGIISHGATFSTST